MNYTLIEERPVKAARKAHLCIWCGQPIAVGESYIYERSIFQGEPQSNHWHPECNDAFAEVVRYEGGEAEFSPYDNDRPAPQHRGEQKP